MKKYIVAMSVSSLFFFGIMILGFYLQSSVLVAGGAVLLIVSLISVASHIDLYNSNKRTEKHFENTYEPKI